MQLVSPSSVVIVESTGRGMQSESFKDRLHAVCCILNNGAIGGGISGYGDPGHVAALDSVEKHIAEVRSNINSMNKDALKREAEYRKNGGKIEHRSD